MKVTWESMVPGHASCLRFLHIHQASFSGALHAHEALEFTWIQSGQGLRFVSETVEPFQDGDLVLVAPRTAHTWMSRGPRQRPASALVVQVQNHDALKALPGWGLIQTRLWEGSTAGLVIGGSLHAAITGHLQAMADASEFDRLGRVLSMLALCAQALDRERTGDCAETPTLRPLGTRIEINRPAGMRRRGRLDRLLRWTHQHLDSPLTVSEASKILNVTPAAFSRAFRQAVGRPFTEYVNDLRIARAQLELLRSDQPVAEIAERCGFSTPSHFYEQFVRRTGLSPNDYRKNVRAGSIHRSS